MNEAISPKLKIQTYVGDLRPILRTGQDKIMVTIDWEKLIHPSGGAPLGSLRATTHIGWDYQPVLEQFDPAITDFLRHAHARMVALAMDYPRLAV